MNPQEIDELYADGLCHWFALCENVADGTVWHPILGSVPTCERCRAMLDLEFEGVA
jgi:hypothetical protein